MQRHHVRAVDLFKRSGRGNIVEFLAYIYMCYLEVIKANLVSSRRPSAQVALIKIVLI